MMHNEEADAPLPDAPLAVPPSECDEVSCDKQDRLGLITLKRPERRNAITAEMRQKIKAAFKLWNEDPDIYTILIQSESGSFFSSGNDVKQIYEASKQGKQPALDLFRDIYEFIWSVECYTKPVISVINGHVMGGGVGLSQSGTHIIAGEQYSWSMPETKLGLFPDVGIAHLLAKMPGAIGLYLGLTGRAINRYDALYLDLLEFCIDEDQFESILEAERGAEPVDSLLDRIKQDPESSIELSDLRLKEPLISEIFSAPTIEEMIDRLESHISKATSDKKSATDKEWLTSVLDDLNKASPTSLKITHVAIVKAKEMTMNAALTQDYNLAHHILDAKDFLGAVEAKLVNKTEPIWQPAKLSDVTEAMVDAYFKIIEGDKLNLPPRELGVNQ